ncbi:MAG: hypothetical protein ABI693_12740 [Bryobacteraceae bacterium]
MLRPLSALTIALALAGCSRQPAQQTVAVNPPVQEAAPLAEPTPADRPVMPGKLSQPQTSEGLVPRTAMIPAGTQIRVRLGQSLDTKTTRSGERFVAHLDQPVVDGDRVIIPRGTAFQGHVVEAKHSGRFKGRAYLAVTLDSFQLHGSTYEIATAASGRSSTSHKKRNLILMGGGSGVGAAIGALAGGGTGALIGAGAGAAAGTTGAYITGKKNVKLPAETPLTFSLQHPVTLRG